MKSFPTFTLETSLLQAIAFVGGYAVHTYFKQSCKCEACLSLLTQDKELEVVDEKDTYKFIQLIDRGALKWPSHIVIDSIIIVLKIYMTIEGDYNLMQQFLALPSRKILIQLTITYIEDTQCVNWRNTCRSCNQQGWTILRKITSIATNCILTNKVRNVNSRLRELANSNSENRKIKKFKYS